jgi:hypothetical protein
MQVTRSLKVVEDEAKYDSILAGVRVAENDPYAGPLLNAMYQEWWNHLM